jgi:XTP/dITP diphosphohydrolase
MDLIFATNNHHKIKEISECLGEKIKLVSLQEVGIDHDIPEEELTLEGNAMAKARYVFEICRTNVFADDTGLEVEALGNLPGVHSARYAGESRDSDANIARLLSELRSATSRKARFRTVIALIYNKKEYLFEGIVSGTITDARKGTGGFGYDPVFMPEGFNKTFAEMSSGEKNRISHRAQAIEKLGAFIESTGYNNIIS